MATRGRPGERGRGRPSRPARATARRTQERAARPGAPDRSTRLERSGELPAVASGATAVRRRRPRLTGRAAILLLVMAVLMASYASSLRAYLRQRDHMGELKAEIAQREQTINALEQEKRRWQDPAYTAQQARARFGYVMPGQRSFIVLDEHGDPVDTGASLDDPADVVKENPTAWWEREWESVKLAGHPPKAKPQDQTVPAELIENK